MINFFNAKIKSPIYEKTLTLTRLFLLLAMKKSRFGFTAEWEKLIFLRVLNVCLDKWKTDWVAVTCTRLHLISLNTRHRSITFLSIYNAVLYIIKLYYYTLFTRRKISHPNRIGIRFISYHQYTILPVNFI